MTAFTRKQVRDRYQVSIEEGSTRMDFESWLLDEINALEAMLETESQHHEVDE